MSERYEIISFSTPKDGGKSYPRKVGSAIPRKDGNGFQIYLDVIPIPEGGSINLVMQLPREKQQQGGGYDDRERW